MPLIFGGFTVYQYDADGVCYSQAPSPTKHYIKSAAHIPQCFPEHVRQVMERWVYPPEIEEGEYAEEEAHGGRATEMVVPDAATFHRGEKIIVLGATVPSALDRERITSMGIMDIRRHTQSMYAFIDKSARASARRQAALERRIADLGHENAQLLSERADSYSDSRRSLFKAMAHTCACPVCDNDTHLAVTFPCMHTAMCIACWNQWAAQADSLEKVVCPNCRIPVNGLWCEGEWRMPPLPAPDTPNSNDEGDSADVPDVPATD